MSIQYIQVKGTDRPRFYGSAKPPAGAKTIGIISFWFALRVPATTH